MNENRHLILEIKICTWLPIFQRVVRVVLIRMPGIIMNQEAKDGSKDRHEGERIKKREHKEQVQLFFTILLHYDRFSLSLFHIF